MLYYSEILVVKCNRHSYEGHLLTLELLALKSLEVFRKKINTISGLTKLIAVGDTNLQLSAQI